MLKIPTENESIKQLLDSGMTSAEIEKEVQDTISRMKFLINEKTALFVIMKKRGLVNEEEKQLSSSEKDSTINNLQENQKNVNIIGRISDFSAMRSFNKKDGSVGHFSSFFLKDPTGDIKVVLWDDRAKYTESESFKLNELVRVINGYVKKNRNDNIEIHVGNKGDIELNPRDVDYKQYPKLKETADIQNISDISLNSKRISILANIEYINEPREFTKKSDGSKGVVQRISVVDKSGSAPLVVWGDDVKKFSDFNRGDLLKIQNLKPKPQYNNESQIELHFQSNSNVSIEKKNVIDKNAPIKTTPIKEVLQKPGMYTIQGEISNVDPMKEINFKDGTTGNLLSLDLSDDTEAIRVTFWRENADKYKDLGVGDQIRISDVLVKFNKFSDRNEGTFGRSSKLENIDLNLKQTFKIEHSKKTYESNNGSKFSGNITNIKDITSDGFFEIKGYVAKDVRRLFVYEACNKCRRKPENCNCENGPEDTSYKIIINIKMDDGTDTMSVGFIGDIAEKFLGMDPMDVKMGVDDAEKSRFLEDISMQLLGRDLIITGRAKFSEYSKTYELTANGFKFIDANEEVKKLIDEIEN